MTKTYRSKALAALHETMSDLHANGALSDARMRDFDAICLNDAAGPRNAGHLVFQMFQDANRAWRWKLVDSRGRVIAQSEITYTTREKALRAIEAVKAAGLSIKAA